MSSGDGNTGLKPSLKPSGDGDNHASQANGSPKGQSAPVLLSLSYATCLLYVRVDPTSPVPLLVDFGGVWFFASPSGLHSFMMRFYLRPPVAADEDWVE
jgi:hypothetical protein